MCPVSYFVSAFKSTLPLDSLRSSSDEASRKRKRDSTALKGGSDGEESGRRSSIGGPNVPNTSSTSPALSSEPLGREDLSQEVATHYETSAQHPGEELAAGSPPRTLSNYHNEFPRSKTKEKINDELATFRPPLYVAAGSSNSVITDKCGIGGLRQRHLNALTAIVHKCMLEGEYVRAGRAWGILLRTEQNGQSMDLRANNRWGLGANILLQREAQLIHKSANCVRTLDEHGIGERYQASSRGFSAQGFDMVKDYYERLVLQYPHRKASPNATGPLQFYIALFGFWIYSIQEQHSLALAEIEKAALNVKQANKSMGNVPNSMSASDLEPHHDRHTDDVRRNTLNGAREILCRLNELLLSPPYSDNARYRVLQAMVNSWISDLLHVSMPSRGGSDVSNDHTHTISQGSSSLSDLDQGPSVDEGL